MTTSFDNFAVKYDEQMGENGDFNHQFAIDPALFELINLESLSQTEKPKIYDVGCGNGYLIFASDFSEKLIKAAREKETSNFNSKSKINYLVCEGADFGSFLEKENATFDLIFANMSLHYIDNLENFKTGILRLLKVGGKFVFTTSHPFGDLKLFSDKTKNQLTKNEMVQIAQNYLTNQSQQVFFGDFPILIHKRSISFYLNFFLKSGFKLEKMLEIPKMKMGNGEIINTQIPAYYGLSFAKN